MMIGNLTSGQIPSDTCLYRSGTEAGEWHYYEFRIANGSFVQGWNSIDFTVKKTTLWHGFMWDSLVLECAAT
jgi:rhamnogalacturonan endolyase